MSISSSIDLKPLAPVFLAIALFAILFRASSLKLRSTESISNKYLYWFTSAFLGSWRILTRASSSNSCRVLITGSLPTNSGINPNFTKSSGSTLSMFILSISLSLAAFTSAENPIPVLSVLSLITLSRPEKAPPQINRIFDVSTWINSCCGCFLPPWGGIEAIVPSISFKRACWTPSPETSLVMEGLSVLRAILSISSM